MKFSPLLFIISMIAASASPAFSKTGEPLILKPSSKWVVSYLDDSCRMARQFGEGDQLVTIFFDRYAPGDFFQLTAFGKPMKMKKMRDNFSIRFASTEEEQKLIFLSGDMDGKPAIIQSGMMRVAAESFSDLQRRVASDPAVDYYYSFSELGAEREAAITSIEISGPLSQPVILESGSLQKPFAIMRQCTNTLLTHWGIDLEKNAKLSRKATPVKSPGKWLFSSDYPEEMLKEGRRALVRFRLSVDAKGKVSDCHIQQSSRPVAFDEAVCKALKKRAEFLPALDADGEPINSYYLNSVLFDMPY